MSCPFSSTVPEARAPRITSCMRLRQRMNVLLPQPEGPMMAVMRLTAISNETFPIAWRVPYQALTSRAHMPAAASSAGVDRDGGATRLVSTTPPGDRPARKCAEHADQGDEHERPTPRFGLPIGVR